MTYCLGIWTKDGLVMASDSRSNAGHDQVNIARKMHTFVQPGERVFILLSSGSLSCTRSIITLLRRDFEQGKGLAQAPSLYDAARATAASGSTGRPWKKRPSMPCSPWTPPCART
jgi:putative proteasome-type protease